MAVLSYLLQLYLVLWLFSGCYGNNLPFYSRTLKAAPLATMHHQGAISGRSLLTSVETGFCHHKFVQDGEVLAQLCSVVDDWQSRENYLVGGFTTLDPSACRNLAAVNLPSSILAAVHSPSDILVVFNLLCDNLVDKTVCSIGVSVIYSCVGNYSAVDIVSICGYCSVNS